MNRARFLPTRAEAFVFKTTSPSPFFFSAVRGTTFALQHAFGGCAVRTRPTDRPRGGLKLRGVRGGDGDGGGERASVNHFWCLSPSEWPATPRQKLGASRDALVADLLGLVCSLAYLLARCFPFVFPRWETRNASAIRASHRRRRVLCGEPSFLRFFALFYRVSIIFVVHIPRRRLLLAGFCFVVSLSRDARLCAWKVFVGRW